MSHTNQQPQLTMNNPTEERVYPDKANLTLTIIRLIDLVSKPGNLTHQLKHVYDFEGNLNDVFPVSDEWERPLPEQLEFCINHPWAIQYFDDSPTCERLRLICRIPSRAIWSAVDASPSEAQSRLHPNPTIRFHICAAMPGSEERDESKPEIIICFAGNEDEGYIWTEAA